MVALYKDPEGKTIFTTTTAGASVGVWNATQGNGNTAGGGEDSSQEKSAEVCTLRKRVTELENALAMMKKTFDS